MATNLIAANHRVKIFDVNPQTFDHFKEQSKEISFDMKIKFIHYSYRTSSNSTWSTKCCRKFGICYFNVT